MSTVLKTRYRAIEDQIMTLIQGLNDGATWTSSNSQIGSRGEPRDYPYLYLIRDPIDTPPASYGKHDFITMSWTIFVTDENDILYGDGSAEENTQDYIFDIYEELKTNRTIGTGDATVEEAFTIRIYPDYRVHGVEGITMAGSALTLIARKRL